MEAVKIPQNVYVEDHIIGPVTLRQLMITGLGAGVSYALFATIQRSGVSNPVILAPTAIPVLICAAFAFIKINDLTLFNIILLVIEGMNKPNVRYWSPHAGFSINLITSQHVKEMNDKTKKARTNADRLVEISRQLEKRQYELSQLATHDIPTPSAVQAIKTRLEKNVKHGLYEHDEETTDEALTPVRTDRVQASGIEKARSIDSITDVVKAYESITADPASSSSH